MKLKQASIEAIESMEIPALSRIYEFIMAVKAQSFSPVEKRIQKIPMSRAILKNKNLDLSISVINEREDRV